MRFWDASALVPLCVKQQPISRIARELLTEDSGVAVWWGTPVECWAAFARLRREKFLEGGAEEAALSRLRLLKDAWTEVQPSEEVRAHAARLLRLHPLRALDVLQLAAALVWAGTPPTGEMVVFDQRLQEAARLEGLTPRP